MRSVQWSKEIKYTFTHNDVLPLVILGLKRDLRSEDDPNGIIYPQEAYRIAQEMRADRYMECSAVSGELLEMVFREMCTMAVHTTDDGGAQTQASCSVM